MLDKDKHRYELVYILQNIYLNTDLAGLLGFKGGTACFMFYNLPRFSVDLDFNLLSERKENFVIDKVSTILERRGKIKDTSIKDKTVFFLYSYGNQDQNIKIEISRRGYQDHYDLLSFLGIDMPVMTKEDMFGYKLVALGKRQKPASRDLFDVRYFFNNHWDYNIEIIEALTKQTKEEYFKALLSYIPTAFPDNKILDGLGELIDNEQKNEVKKRLKEDVIFDLRLQLT